MLKNILCASAVLFAAASTQAVTYSSTPGNGLVGKEHVIDDFEKTKPPAGIIYTGSYTIDKYKVTNFRAPPAGDTTKYFATPATNLPLPGSATIDFTDFIKAHGALKTISFYWGSIDAYNTLSLDGTGFVGHTTFSGTDINNPANGDQSAPATNRRVSFTFSKGEAFTGLTLTSSQRAFEIDNIAATVPEPATWLMLMTGFSLVGGAVRLRSRSVAA